MKPDPILEEVWRIKDELSREMEIHPSARDARFKKLIREEKASGRRIIHSTEDLRRYVQEEGARLTAVLNEKPSDYGKT